MGVYLPNMEMPKEYGPHEITITLFVRDDGTASLWGKEVFIPHEPLEVVTVPPHGRLVDADRLLSEHMKRKYYNLPNGDTAIPIIDVEHAPTVIPAEEVYGQYADTAGNLHWCGTHSGEHKIKAEEGE